MLFNSAVFLVFFAGFLLLYYLVRHSLAARNALIVVASYAFYGWWDWRFLSLLWISSLVDYAVGRALEPPRPDRHRRAWLALSLIVNLGLLGFFKYYGFFVDSFIALLDRLGLDAEPRLLRVVLPVGISFYTFQSLSYALDVYRRQLTPTRNLVSFLAYVSFFPQLVAGPIERARHLLPQFERTLTLTRTQLVTGVWLILWGMFKKVVLADNLAPLVELVYGQPAHAAPLVALGTIAFAFQIYCDFSGYSDIARGLASVLGFELRLNFNLPYLATNLREFWRRWHISLSTWLRDYLYVSLGGNRHGPSRTRLNLLLTMLLGGLWHGAAWNFVLWGLWHGIGLLVHRWWSERPRATPLPQPEPHPAPGRQEPTPPQPPNPLARQLLAWSLTMLVVGYGWLLFRAQSWADILTLTSALAQWSVPPWFASYALNLAAFTLPLILMQSWQATTKDLLAPLTLPAWTRALLQGCLLTAIVLFWRKDSTPFIYFQF
ncbi:MAG: MBOAT family protein [Verrucomicrobia bacterium]|nr:MBOAT family protein [Verrucomicrobiota bacterium]